MPSISFSIGGPSIDISNKSSDQVLDIIKKEYNKETPSTKPKFKVIKKKKEEEEEDCVCGNNFHKGWVDGVMRCEDCDIDGKNYEGSNKEADVVEIVGCDA